MSDEKAKEKTSAKRIRIDGVSGKVIG